MKFDTDAARQQIFSRIRQAQQRPPSLQGEEERQARLYIDSRARGPGPQTVADLVACFEERSLRLASTVARVAAATDVAGEVQRYLRSQDLPSRLVVWPALRAEPWVSLLTQAGVQLRFGAPVGTDLVGLSGVDCAIAETGTLMMGSGPDTPASMHLLPETHLAIVRESQIVMTLEDAFDHWRLTGRQMPRALNLVSGPSRTGDIEQTIVLGAHGPYRVHIIILMGQ